jgi:hypothetical protein
MDFQELHKELVRRVLEEHGATSHAERRAAFDNACFAEPLRAFVDKVANAAYTISDEDVDAVRKSGVSEDQIFELVVCAAVGQATRQYDHALRALNEAVADNGGQGHPA